MAHAEDLAYLRSKMGADEFGRKLNEKLREWEKSKRSGRLHLYVDVRSGQVMSYGVIDSVSQPWTQEKP